MATYGGKQVLGPISLEFRPGECVALIGASGAGKSTLLNLLYEQARGDAAYIPQELGLVQSLSVFHNTYMGRLSEHSSWYNLGTLIHPRKKDIKPIEPILERLAIEQKIWSPVSELSGGQKQRTAVARVLYQGAQLLLADEPVSALDGPKAERVMQAMIESYPTSIIALHDVQIALKYAQRIIGIGGGQVVLDAPSHTLSPGDLADLY
jgi:phosphonate transport system ATP-binding protein